MIIVTIREGDVFENVKENSVQCLLVCESYMVLRSANIAPDRYKTTVSHDSRPPRGEQTLREACTSVRELTGQASTGSLVRGK